MSKGRFIIYTLLAALVVGICNFAVFSYFLNGITRSTLSDYARSEIASMVFTTVLPIYLVLALVVSFVLIRIGTRPIH